MNSPGRPERTPTDENHRELSQTPPEYREEAGLPAANVTVTKRAFDQLAGPSGVLPACLSQPVPVGCAAAVAAATNAAAVKGQPEEERAHKRTRKATKTVLKERGGEVVSRRGDAQPESNGRARCHAHHWSVEDGKPPREERTCRLCAA